MNETKVSRSSDDDERSALVGLLVDEFMERQAAGDGIDLDEFLVPHPDVADEVREQLRLIRTFDQLVGSQGDPTPKALGDFQVLREIGRGGMGIVYEAEQLSLGRRVALKILPLAAVLDERQLERFRNEARAAAQLHHENIVPVHAVGSERGVHFYAMQLIEGQSLQGILRDLRRQRDGDGAESLFWELLTTRQARSEASAGSEQRRSEQQRQSEDAAPSGSSTAARATTAIGYFRSVAGVALQAAGALHYSHELGIIHRDVKPGNLLVDRSGKLWVTDFGLAQFSHDAGLTLSGEVMGTLRYMSPEQASGERRQVDERSDVYSLGVTLYELVTLEVAFSGKGRAEVLDKILRHPPRAPRSVRREVPVDLETIILKATEKNASDRYQSMVELADDLRAFIADRPIRARRATIPERVFRWCRRNRLVASLLGLAALLALVALVAAFVATTVQRARELAEGERARAQVFAALADARSRRTGIDPGQSEDSLPALGAAARQLAAFDLDAAERTDLEFQLRDELVASSSRLDVRVEKRWVRSHLESGVISPDFSHFVEATREGDLIVTRVEDGSEVARLPAPLSAPSLARFTESGRFVLASYDPAGRRRTYVVVWDWRRREQVFAVPGLQAFLSYDVSADERSICSVDIDGAAPQIVQYDLASGALLRRRPAPEGAMSLRCHPDGRLVAIQCHRRVILCDLDDSARDREVPLPQQQSYSIKRVAWSPDGSRLACGAGHGSVYVVATSTLELVAVASGHQGGVVGVAFHPAGRLIATASWDGTTRVFDAFTGEPFLRLMGSAYSGIRFSADGTRLGCAGVGLDVWYWRMQQSSLQRVSRHDSLSLSPATALTISVDGRLAATAHINRDHVRLWDLETGRVIARLPTSEVGTVIFDSKTSDLLLAGPRYGVQRFPVVRTGAGAVRIGPPRSIPALRGQERAAIDSTGRHIVAWKPGGAAVVADLGPAGKSSRPVTVVPNSTMQAVVAPSGIVACVTGNWPALGDTVRVIDPASGRVLLEHESNKTMVEFSPDGQWLVVSKLDEVLVYSARNFAAEPWRIEIGFPRDTPERAVFSRDSEILATQLDQRESVRLFRVSTRQPLVTLRGPDLGHVLRHAISPGGRFLVVIGSNNTLRSWNLVELSDLLERHAVPLPWSPEVRGETVDDAPLEVDILAGVVNDFGPALRDPADEATLERIDRAIVATPNDPELHRQRAFWYRAQGREERALGDIDRALALGVNPSHLRDRSDILRQLRRHPEALTDRRRALEVDLRDPSGHELERLSEFEFDAGEVRQAILTLERTARRHELSVDGRRRLEVYRRDLLPRFASFESIDALLARATPVLARELADGFEDIASPEDAALREYLEARTLVAEGEDAGAVSILAKLLRDDANLSIPVEAYLDALARSADGRTFEAGVRALLESGRSPRQLLWRRWEEAAFGKAGLSVEELIARLPRPPEDEPDRRREDLAWLLGRLRDGRMLRIDCMAADFTTAGGIEWHRDCFAVGGQFGRGVRREIDATDDDELYRLGRMFPETTPRIPGYRIPLPPGRYELILHVAEVSLRATQPDRLPHRTFDVFLEGRSVLSNYSPPAFRLERKRFEVDVEDGFLDVDFGTRKGMPMINAFEIGSLGQGR